jgi:dipeptidyl aminopeptidase/acylaminoacyl peptidase
MSTRRIAIEDLLSLRLVDDVTISPDGRDVAYTLRTIEKRPEGDEPAYDYRSHVWVVDAQTATSRQFTAGAHRDRDPAWSPDGQQLLFASNRGAPSRPGAKPATHLWAISRAGGEARRLTQAEHNPSEAAWSPDGRLIVFSGKTPAAKPASDIKIITRIKHKFDGEGFWDSRYKHIFLIPADGGPARQLTSGDFDHREPVWSPDGTRVAFITNRAADADYTNVADIWVLTIATGDLRRLTRGLGPIAAPAWSPDGATIAYLGHDNICVGASNTMLWVVPADGSGEARCLTRHYDRSLAHHLLSDMRAHPRAGRPVWSRDSRTVFVMVADCGTTQLAAVDVVHDTVRLMTTGRRDIYGESYDAARSRIALAVGDPATPGDVWIANVDGVAEGRPSVPAAGERRLTSVNAGLLAEIGLSAPQRFAYRGGDDWTIEGWVMPPADFDPAKKYPTILCVHGGPHFAYGESFFHEFQVLAAQGYAVVFTNPRGSQGYGQTFTSATHHDWGGKDYEDIMTGLDAALGRFSYLDAGRLGVQGGSYGGFMTNWIVGHTHRFKAGVTMRSIANCLSQWGTSDMAYFKGTWEFPGDPWDSPEFYWERSPIKYAKNITTPLLIEHSENDLRCPISEGEQLFTALKKLGREVMFVRFPDESHDLSRNGQPQHRLERLRLITEWFAKYLPPVAVARQPGALAGTPGGEDGAGT